MTVEVIDNPLDPETTYLEMLKAGARLHQPTSVPATHNALKPDPLLFACG